MLTKAFTPRAISDDEIVNRLVLAMVRRGRHRFWKKALPPKASDIDMVYLTGYGFPAGLGWPDAVRRTRRACPGQADEGFPGLPAPRGLLDAGAAHRRAWWPEGKTFTGQANLPTAHG